MELDESELQTLHNASRIARIRGVGANPEVDEDNTFAEKYNIGTNPRKRRGAFLTLLWMVIAVAIPIIALIVIRNAFVPVGYTSISTDRFALSFIAAGAFGLTCLSLLPTTSRWLIQKMENRFGISPAEFSKAAASTYSSKVAVLLAFIITFPFMTLGMNTYAGFNDTGIVYSSFFSTQEVKTQFTEIENINRYFHRDNSGRISSMHYVVYLNNNQRLDVLFSDRINQAYTIHNKILAVNPSLFLLSVDEPEEDVNRFLRTYSTERQRQVRVIFGL